MRESLRCVLGTLKNEVSVCRPVIDLGMRRPGKMRLSYISNDALIKRVEKTKNQFETRTRLELENSVAVFLRLGHSVIL